MPARSVRADRGELRAGASDLKRLASAAGDHPIANLLLLVGGVESISDAQWAKVHARVTEAFGRQLAVYAARGRLVIAPEPAS